MTIRSKLLYLLLATCVLTLPTSGHESKTRKSELFMPGAEHATALPSTTGDLPPLVGTKSGYGMPNSTKSALAQSYFELGLEYLRGFNHAEAVRAFRAGQVLDPDCAMCFWGEAYALGPNLNDTMHPGNEARAIEAAALAQVKARSPFEAALSTALTARYSKDGERAAHNGAFAEAMDGVAQAFPHDPNVLVILADAKMNLQPWDYWETDGVTPKGATAEILAALESALELAPDHPAALHLYIHAVEASADPGRAESAADRLAAIEPTAGHLVHMPAHIYNRLGRFADSIAANKAAIRADEKFLAAAGDAASPLYRFGYYPHNVHFLLVAAQMAGMADEAIAASEKLAAITSDEVSAKIGWVQAIRTAPYTAHVQFSETATILALPDPGDDFPFVKGHWHYARGIAFARSGDLDAAKAEVAAIAALIATADFEGLEAQLLPARDLLGIAEHVVEARIRQAQGDGEAAIRHLELAITLEDGIAYMEPSYWYYPIRQTLGAAHLQMGNNDNAAAAFRAALAQTPNNGWALWGLTQADPKDVKAAAALERAWLGTPELLHPERL